MSETRASICRFCHASCGIQVEIEDGRSVKVYGDKDNPVYHGYTCAKGRALPEVHAHPDRLLHSQKRLPDGSFTSISSSQAMDEVAERLSAIIERHGPRSVAMYHGTYSFPYPASSPVASAFMHAIGSRMTFTSASIDQPGKPIALALHGRWLAGPYQFDECDAWMLVGVNPVVSMSNGIPNTNPARRLHRAKQRGLKLLIVDPRRSETAESAHLHLQPRPGEDPTILAGMLRWITRNDAYDAEFTRHHVDGLDALIQAVEPFTPEYVERRAGVPAADLVEAARIFAEAGRAGVTAGTGPNMAPRGNLTEYLVLALTTLCGHWRRAGEVFPNPFVLFPEHTPRAEATAPRRGWGFGERLRVRDLTDCAAGLSAAALADEILLPGEGQVRALFNLGGNPLSAWPDQLKTQRALESLDLCVSLEPKMAATARQSDYVIAPKICFEVPGVSMANESLWFYAVGLGYPGPYAQYAPTLVEPPAGSDLIEEWSFFYGLAQRMGLDLTLQIANIWGPRGSKPRRVALDMQNPPTTDELIEELAAGSRVPLAEVKRHPKGAMFEPEEPVIVEPAGPDAGRMDVGNEIMLGELHDVAGETPEHDEAFPFRLICRRMPDVLNSTGRDVARLTRHGKHNPAYMHPDDLVALGLATGDVVEIASTHASILGIVEAAPDVRPGVVSMAHSFGDVPERDHALREIGSNTGRLVANDRDYDPYSGIPRMSAIPVDIRRSAAATPL
jgi:anaerobic selenocysteine-containing dehydrogenase